MKATGSKESRVEEIACLPAGMSIDIGMLRL